MDSVPVFRDAGRNEGERVVFSVPGVTSFGVALPKAATYEVCSMST